MIRYKRHDVLDLYLKLRFERLHNYIKSSIHVRRDKYYVVSNGQLTPTSLKTIMTNQENSSMAQKQLNKYIKACNGSRN